MTTKLSHVNDINYFSFEFKYVKYCNSLDNDKIDQLNKYFSITRVSCGKTKRRRPKEDYENDLL